MKPSEPSTSPPDPGQGHASRRSKSSLTSAHRYDRYECKYLISEAVAAALLRSLGPYIEHDGFARRNGGRYLVSSLYLDTPTLRLHREKLEGQRNRFKLRVRTYSDREEDPVFLEIKRRRDAVISKARSPLQRDLLRGVLRFDEVSALVEEPYRQLHAEFAGLLMQIGAQPIVCVRYEREAYMGVYDLRARLTFDRRIQCRAGRDLSVNGAGWSDVESRRVILEMKFNGACPAWMARAVHRHGLDRVSYSKYSSSVLAAQRRGALAASGVAHLRT